MTPGIDSLEALVAPLRVAHFIDSHWHRRPLHGPGEAPGRFDALFPLGELEQLLMVCHARDVRFTRGSLAVPRSRFVAPGSAQTRVHANRLLALYREGGRLCVSHVQRYRPHADRLLQAVRRQLHAAAAIELRIGHHGSDDDPPHPTPGLDKKDVFILQLHGCERWQVHEPHRPGAPALDVEIGPGDMLYVPAHAPCTVSLASADAAHLALSVEAWTWHDVFGAMLAQAGAAGSPLDSFVPVDLIESGGQRLREALREHLTGSIDAADPALWQGLFDAARIDAAAHTHEAHFLREILANTAA